MLKELTVKEALQLLAEKYPEPVECYLYTNKPTTKRKAIATSIDVREDYSKLPFCDENGVAHAHFAIEVPDEYRYMTQQECIDWVCLHGSKGYQIKNVDWCEDIWNSAFGEFFPHPEKMIYRTIQEIGGKIVYGEPQEFKVRVE